MQKYKDQLKAKRHQKILFHTILMATAVIVVIVGAMYLLFFVRLFDVRNVTTGVPDALRADIAATISQWLSYGFWKVPRKNNILFLPTNKLVAQLSLQFPKLENIQVKKRLPHSLIISSDERKPVGIWCLTKRGKCFYFDQNGIAFSETQGSTGFLVLNVEDQRAKELKLGDKVAADPWLANVLKAKGLSSRINVNISGLVIPADSFDEFYAKTAGGWRVLFSNSTNIESQISALNMFLKEKLKPEQKATLQYIDLRIQDRIYYK